MTRRLPIPSCCINPCKLIVPDAYEKTRTLELSAAQRAFSALLLGPHAAPSPDIARRNPWEPRRRRVASPTGEKQPVTTGQPHSASLRGSNAAAAWRALTGQHGTTTHPPAPVGGRARGSREQHDLGVRCKRHDDVRADDDARAHVFEAPPGSLPGALLPGGRAKLRRGLLRAPGPDVLPRQLHANTVGVRVRNGRRLEGARLRVRPLRGPGLRQRPGRRRERMRRPWDVVAVGHFFTDVRDDHFDRLRHLLLLAFPSS